MENIHAGYLFWLHIFKYITSFKSIFSYQIEEGFWALKGTPQFCLQQILDHNFILSIASIDKESFLFKTLSMEGQQRENLSLKELIL